MIVSINQPAYLPWLGYFERILLSDLHVVLDHVQFEKNSFTNRNRIRSKHGPIWLTVPVATKGKFGHLPIRDLEFADDGRWQTKHWRSLTQEYSAAAYFSSFAPAYELLYKRKWGSFAEMLHGFTGQLLADLMIRTPVVAASTLPVTGSKTELIVDICKSVGATTYLSGPLGRDYLNSALFDEAGIALRFHDFQLDPENGLDNRFQVPLAAIDHLFHRGPELAGILRQKIGTQEVH